MSTEELQGHLTEVRKCRKSLAHFATRYCKIPASSDRSGVWLPFTLWPAQQDVARDLEQHREVIALKARQLGFTWLVVALALRELLFNPVATVLLFSKRDDEAAELVGFRLREMYARLPAWMRSDAITADKAHEFALSTGSRALAFATTGGRSYTATLAIIDEADHVGDLQRMLNAVKPTVDAGGRLILLSTVDKSEPVSTFKRIYRAAKAGENSFHPIFAPWTAAPWRTHEWYQEKRKAIVTATGAEDDLHQEYPATDAEALAPRSLDKRLSAEWLLKCYQQQEPRLLEATPWCRPPAIPGLAVYALPVPGRRYVVGADPAEGNPTSDPSALEVLDVDRGEEVASLAGRFEPATFAAHVDAVGRWYNFAPVMVERNNHGHAVLLWLRDNSGLTRLCGHDMMSGWHTTTKGKAMLYDRAGEALRDGEAIIHGLETFSQLASIEGSTLRAPDGQHDDQATAFALALQGRARVLLLFSPRTDEQWPCVLVPGREPF
jgi:hypothetical protein